MAVTDQMPHGVSPLSMIVYLLFIDPLFVHRTEVLAGAIVGTLLVHTEGIPCRWAEHLVVGHVVHTYGDAQDRGEGDDVGTDVAIGDGTVVGSQLFITE